MNKDIGIKSSWGSIEQFTDNSIPICPRCGCKITQENKSQWADVIKENKTQYICKDCETPEEKGINDESS